MNKIYPLLALTIILTSSGCTSLSSFNPLTTSPSIAELANNPENYLNKEVTLTTKYLPTVMPYMDSSEMTQPNNMVHYYIYDRDEEGKLVVFPLVYPKFYCTNCQITGIVEKKELCVCQRQDCYSDVSCENWYKVIDRPPIECAGAEASTTSFGIPVVYNYSCKSNSNYSFYYLYVTKVKSMDN